MFIRKQIIVTKVQKQNPQQYTLHYAFEAIEEVKSTLCELKMWEFKLEPSTYSKIREDANYSVTFPSNPRPKILYINGDFEIKYGLNDKKFADDIALDFILLIRYF